MSLLSVTVKKACYTGAQAEQMNTYVTLKLQNVKSSTSTVKGSNPCWEQDFVFETNDINVGLLFEVWSKGTLWDSILGYYYIPLTEISYASENGSGQWVTLNLELEKINGEVVGTKIPSDHSLLIDCRFEPPFDLENTQGLDLQRKLEMLNNRIDPETKIEPTQHLLIYNPENYQPDDSGYTSDLIYSVNGRRTVTSASQIYTFSNHLMASQHCFEAFRDNSYEYDDNEVPQFMENNLNSEGYNNYIDEKQNPRHNKLENISHPQYFFQQNIELSEPLYYNSRPICIKKCSQDGWYTQEYAIKNLDIGSSTDYDCNIDSATTNSDYKQKKGLRRKPSLERQNTLYEEQSEFYNYNDDPRDRIDYNNHSNIIEFDYEDERYDHDDEDRQWDSGGNLDFKPIDESNGRNNSFPSFPEQYHYELQMHTNSVVNEHYESLPAQEYSSIPLERTGKRLPPTPNKPSNVILGRISASLPAIPGRQLPCTRTLKENLYFNKPNYNENYNYAYESQENSQRNVSLNTEQNLTQTSMSTTVSHNKFMNTFTELPKNEDEQFFTGMQIQNSCPPVETSIENAHNVYENTLNSLHKDIEKNIYATCYSATLFSSNIESQENHLYEENQDVIMQDTYDNSMHNHDVTHQSSQPVFEQESQLKNQYIIDNSLSLLDEKQFALNTSDKSYNEYKQMCFQNDEYTNETDTDNLLENSKSRMDNIHEQNLNTNKSVFYRNLQNDNVIIERDSKISISDQELYSNLYDEVTIPETITDDLHQQINVTNNFSKDTLNDIEYDTNILENNHENHHQIYTNSFNHYHENDDHNSKKDQENCKINANEEKTDAPEFSITAQLNQMKSNSFIEKAAEFFNLHENSKKKSSSDFTEKNLACKNDVNQQFQGTIESPEVYDKDREVSFVATDESVNVNTSKKINNEYIDSEESTPVGASHTLQIYTQSQNLSKDYVIQNNDTENLIQNSFYDDLTDKNECLTLADSYQEEIENDFSKTAHNEYKRKDSQLSHQSYQSQHSNQSKINDNANYVLPKAKLMRGDSLTSNQSSDSFTRRDPESTRKESYSSITHEEYAKNKLKRIESYQSIEYDEVMHNQKENTLQPISRAESYQRGYFTDQESFNQPEHIFDNAVTGDYKMMEDTLERYERGEQAMRRGSSENLLNEMRISDSPRDSIRKQASLDESVQMDTPPRSPLEPPNDEDLTDIVRSTNSQMTERIEMTPKQRWHVAYNKIIMQLNMRVEV